MTQQPTLTSLAQVSATGLAPLQPVALANYAIRSSNASSMSPVNVSRFIRNAAVDEFGHTIVFEFREPGQTKWTRARLSIQFDPLGKPKIEASPGGYVAQVYYLVDDAEQARSELVGALDAALGRVASEVTARIANARHGLLGMHVAETHPEPLAPAEPQPASTRRPRP